jgi:HNH endonuclease
MALSPADIKKLWGRAGGRCSEPQCGRDCVPFLDSNGPIVIGEMAHVIPQSTTGPRGGAEAGEDTYENTILLCPTHHTIVDKAPENFPRETLLAWKKTHEEKSATPFRDGVFDSKEDLCREVATILIENKAIWSQWGPESSSANTNPISNAALIWQLRKLDGIIPRNARIVRLIESHRKFFRPNEYRICCKFIQHADAFAKSAINRLDEDAQPRFPSDFADLMNQYV